MLRFLFFLFILFFFAFLGIRAVVRAVLRGLFFIRKGAGSSRGESPRTSYSSGPHIEEADYEVIESRIQNKEQDAG